MKSRNIKGLLVGFILSAALLLTGCTSTVGSALLSTGTATAESAISQEDNDAQWDAQSAVSITFSGADAAITGSGATFTDGALIISEPGTYVLSGNLDDGQVRIDAAKGDTIRLVLNGVTVSNSTGSALYEKKAGKVIITLAEGTENSLTDGSEYVLEQDETEPDAALYAKDSLTINGLGNLTVTGNYNHGIVSKDHLIITGGTLSVSANGTGIRGRDSLNITDGDITVTAAGDALQANNSEDATKGSIDISGGTFHLTAGKDGIQAETTLNISGGSFTIYSGGETESVSSTTVDATSQATAALTATPTEQPSQSVSFPTKGAWAPGGNTQKTNTESGKGLKAVTGLNITGGSFEIHSADDTVHTNGNAVIENGTLTLYSDDDGIHADGDITIKSGIVAIEQSYEGLEAANIIIEGGEIQINADDDGFNAAGGNDGSSLTSWRGQGGFEASGDYSIRISGGTIHVNASGDGLDSNGDMYMSGGFVTVDGPTNNGNGALDYNGVFELTGGTLAVSGSAGMAQGTSKSANQATLMVYGSGSGTVTLKDSNGNEILSYTPAKAYQMLAISTPQLKQGETYTLSIADQTSFDITLTDAITTYSTDGTQGGSFNRQFPGGGQGGPGGGRRGP